MNDNQHQHQHDQTVEKPVLDDTSSQSAQEASPLTSDPVVTKRRKWPWIVLVILVIIAAIAAAIAIYFVVKPPVKQVKEVTVYTSAQSAVDAVTTQIDKTPLVVTSLDGLGGTTQDNYLVWDLPFYKVGDNKFLNAPTEGTGKGYAGNSIDATKQFTTLSSFFKNLEYKQIEDGTDFKGYLSYDQAVFFKNYNVYESDNMVCAVSHMDATDTLLKNHVASVGCAEKANYKKAAEALQPFYTAYTKNKDNSSTELVFGNAMATKGSDGYESAVLYQEDPAQVFPDDGPNFFKGYYYKVPNDTKWTFVTSAQRQAPCSTFNTDVLKKAFKGVECYDATTKKSMILQ